MKNFRLLITGGTGFIGKTILRKFLVSHPSEYGFSDVVVLARNPQKLVTSDPLFQGASWLKLVQGDVLEYNSLLGLNAKFIIHAAADSTIGPQLALSDRFEQIVRGTQNILKLAVASNAARVLYLSSGAVYGHTAPSSLGYQETDLCTVDSMTIDSTYSLAKLAAEHLHTELSSDSGLEYVIARCFSFIGPDLPFDAHFAVGNFIRDALLNEKIVVHGDGCPLRTYLDQTDLAEWLLTILLRGRPGEVYNVGSNEVISIGDLAHKVRDLIASNKTVFFEHKSYNSTVRKNYIPDISKAKSDLNLRVRMPLERAIMKTALSYQRLFAV